MMQARRRSLWGLLSQPIGAPGGDRHDDENGAERTERPRLP
jgi:hypothetical protein